MDINQIREEFRHLRECLDRGEITQAYYERAVQRLRDSAGDSGSVDPFATPQGDSYQPRRSTCWGDLLPDMEIGPEDNRFRLVREIGGGAMGRVWLAHDLEEERLEGGESYKALKVVNPALQDLPRALEGLKREAIRASRLSHDNIIRVYGCRQGRDGWLFVVMDYLEGRNLDRLLLDEGNPGLSWERSLPLLESVASALDYAHAHHIVHRDLKPGNVFIDQESKVKLLDFGLAYRLHRSSTLLNIQELGSSGTPEYMPPEAFAAGRPDKAQDIYALACLVYEMLTGEPPYTPEAACRRSPDLLPDKPEELRDAAWAVLKSGLAYRKEERPGSAGELVQQLRAEQRAPETPPPPEVVERSPLSAPQPPPQEEREKKDADLPSRERVTPKVIPPETKRTRPHFGKDLRRAVELIALTILGSISILFNYSWMTRDEAPDPVTPPVITPPVTPAPTKLAPKPEPARPARPAIQDIHGWSADKVQALQRRTAQLLDKPVEFRDLLKDGGQGPVMVVIPGGIFQMGSPPNEPGRYDDEGQHQVQVAAFAIGKYEVTFEEYDRFAEATKRQKPADEGWGRGRRPVINVGWIDATEYVKWLSQQTGYTYRLPTEAEWEYAARAGTTTPFYFGNTISTDRANYNGNYTYGNGRKGVYREKTVEVGQFPANAWGLQDMHGNVWEWTCSEYDKSYGGAELRCEGENSSGPRVLRGGSWSSGPLWLRGAARFAGAPRGWSYDWGFRLARQF